MKTNGLHQSLEGIKAIASLGGGAIVIWLVYSIAGVIMTDAASRAPGGYGGKVANDWLSTGLDSVLPAAFVLLVFFGLVASAILSRSGY